MIPAISHQVVHCLVHVVSEELLANVLRFGIERLPSWQNQFLSSVSKVPPSRFGNAHYIFTFTLANIKGGGRKRRRKIQTFWQ